MSLDWSQYTLSELREHAIHTFRKGGGSRPDVLLIEINGERAVLKDQASADRLFALLIGPILNWRECKALRKLQALDCIPDLLHVPDRRSFLMAYHESEQITHVKRLSPNWPDFFAQLKQSIEQMHEAGVTHNDLRNPTNTLITPQGKPILVDLVGCFCQGARWNLPKRWIFNKFRQVDLSAITKIKSKVAPQLVQDTDLVAQDIAGRPGMVIKRLGQLIRKISRALFTK